jgi:hypothetical protein
MAWQNRFHGGPGLGHASLNGCRYAPHNEELT